MRALLDFVVVGIVIGAAIVGAGAFLRDLGPRVRPRITRPDASQVEPERLTFAWTRFCQSLGMAVTTLGFLIVVATVIVFFLNASDGVGWTVVGASAVLGVVGSVGAAVVIGRHYLRGGFDPVVRAEREQIATQPSPILVESTNVIEADQAISLAHDDPFELVDRTPALAEAVAPVEPSAEPQESVPELVTEPPLASAAAEPTYVEEPPASGHADVEPDVGDLVSESPDQEEPVAPPELTTIEIASPFANELDPDAGPMPEARWDRPERQSTKPSHPTPSTQVPVLSGFEPPLIGPDDELPAWSAPPVVRTPLPPVPQLSPSWDGPGAFESSLLADLTPDVAQGEELAGPFQSRLLNELTASPKDLEPPGKDVLIAESPASPDSSRGAGSAGSE